MSQNTSHAVMSQRWEARDSLDDFPTPPWATRALCEKLTRGATMFCSVWEPAAGRGCMARPLAEAFGRVYASDLGAYGFCASGVDFTRDTATNVSSDWVVTNPPFREGALFVLIALALARRGVAVLVRTQWLETAERYEYIYRDLPPSRVLQFVERVPMVRGRLDRKASTATSYMWLVWERGAERRPIEWIAPCRARLERDEDYA